MKVISSISNSVKFYIASQDFMHLRAKFFVMEPCNYISQQNCWVYVMPFCIRYLKYMPLIPIIMTWQTNMKKEKDKQRTK